MPGTFFLFLMVQCAAETCRVVAVPHPFYSYDRCIDAGDAAIKKQWRENDEDGGSHVTPDHAFKRFVCVKTKRK